MAYTNPSPEIIGNSPVGFDIFHKFYENKRQRIKMDNPEKFATQGTQYEENKPKTQYVLDTTIHNICDIYQEYPDTS